MPGFDSFSIMENVENILSKLDMIVSPKIDSIKTVVDESKTMVSNIKTLVSTNNVANKNGIISQKESYTIDLLENRMHGSLQVNSGASINWICPAGVKVVMAELLSGAGGGGGGAGGYTVDINGNPYYSHPMSGNSGASGATGSFIFVILPVSPGVSYNIVAGAGGAGGAGGVGALNINPVFEGNNGKNGGAGGYSKFGNLITVPGGGGGQGGKFNFENTDVANSGYPSSFNTIYPALIYSSGIKGNDGFRGDYSSENTFHSYVAGASSANKLINNGASSSSSGIGGRSGSGGYGSVHHDNGYGGEAFPGEAGRKGSDGFVKVFW